MGVQITNERGAGAADSPLHRVVSFLSSELLSASDRERSGRSGVGGLPLVVAYGGGVNSTALLIGLREKGIVPDLITFADTGGELPETYAFVESFSARLVEWGFPAVVTVRKTYRGGFEGLEKNCLRKKMLPGLAYGTRSCSTKYKGEPQDGYLEKWVKRAALPWRKPPAKVKQKMALLRAWCEENAVLPVVTKAIGYDAGEPRRTKRPSMRPDLFRPWYPLVEWGWTREKCLLVLGAAGFGDVPKSACWFCPAMKKWEVLEMQRTHPELIERALTMEATAQETTERGLGAAAWHWKDLLSNDEAQSKLDLWKQTEERNVNAPVRVLRGINLADYCREDLIAEVERLKGRVRAANAETKRLREQIAK